MIPLLLSLSASYVFGEEKMVEQMNGKKDTPPTILMIELDDDTRPILKKILYRYGYSVLVALEEEDALALVRGGRDRPELILLDQVNLPIDEFINMGRRIRQGTELPSNTPIVVMALTVNLLPTTLL